MLANRGKAIVSLLLVSVLLSSNLIGVVPVMASPHYPTSGEFIDHKGVPYTASWDYETYSLRIDGKFPWNAAAFAGDNGSVAIWDTGEIKSMKARNYASLSHAAKIGIRDGSQGSWIDYPQTWYITPGWIGYSTRIMNLDATVKATFLGNYDAATGVVEMTLSNPFNSSRSVSVTYAQAMAVTWDYGVARPGLRYAYNYDKAFYNATLDAIVAQDTRFGWLGYLYSDLPIADWSASDCCSLNKYVTFASLDKQNTAGTAKSDANVAMRVNVSLGPLESKTFHFFTSLDPYSRGGKISMYRSNISTMMASLGIERLNAMKMLPLVRTTDAEVNLEYFLVNYVFASMNQLHHPWIYGAEDMSDYTSDNLMFAVTKARYLPQDYLVSLKNWLIDRSYRLYQPGERPIPYTVPDHVLRWPNDNIALKADFSDVTGTAMWIMAVLSTYEASGDMDFLQTIKEPLTKTLGAIEKYDSDADGFPNIKEAMTDLRGFAGTHAFESAMAGYGFRDGAFLLYILGDTQNADHFRSLYERIAANYDSKFWDYNISYPTNYDALGNSVPDRWVHNIFVPQWGDILDNRINEMLSVLESPDFTDPVWGVRWQGVGDPHFTGVKMEGGFWVSTPLFVASAEFLADRNEMGTQYMKVSARQAVRGGFFDETYTNPPSLEKSTFKGSNIYIEPAVYGLDALIMSLGLNTYGSSIYVTPKLTFDSFEIDNITVWSMGHQVTLKISKSSGVVSVTKTSDDGGYFSIFVNEQPGNEQEFSSITVNLSPSTVVYGNSVEATANISAPVNDGLVTFEQSINKIEWYPITNGSGTPTNGTYSFTWTPSFIGKVFIRASWNGNANYAGSTSSAETLTINKASNMTLDISMTHTGNSITLNVQGQSRYNNGVPFVGQVTLSHKDAIGTIITSKTITTDFNGNFASDNLMPVYGLNNFEAGVDESGVPITKSHTATLSATLTRVQWSSLSLVNGQTLNVTFTVQNTGDITLATQSPPPGYRYLTNENFQSKGFPSSPNAFRVGVDYSTRPSPPQYPYRWGLGDELLPGNIVNITGSIKINTTNKSSITAYGGLIYESSTLVSDNVSPVTIRIN